MELLIEDLSINNSEAQAFTSDKQNVQNYKLSL